MEKPVFGKTDNGKSGIWKNHRWSEPTHGKTTGGRSDCRLDRRRNNQRWKIHRNIVITYTVWINTTLKNTYPVRQEIVRIIVMK